MPPTDGPRAGPGEVECLEQRMTFRAVLVDDWVSTAALLAAKCALWYDQHYRLAGGPGFDLADRDVAVTHLAGGVVLVTVLLAPLAPDPIWPARRLCLRALWEAACRDTFNADT